MTSFREKWLAAVEAKNSVLCAGLDPAEFGMERGEEGLPKATGKYDWAFDYVKAVAPFCAAVKPNYQYWKGEEEDRDIFSLKDIVDHAHDLGLVVIDDSKLADIGSTNDAGLYHAKQKGFDAVTLAPFAGNMKEAAEQARKRDLGLISMCLMSNPEYEKERKSLVPVLYVKGEYSLYDVINNDGETFVRKYIQLAHDAAEYGVDGVVVGAPSNKNSIKEEELSKVRQYVGDKMLVLLPGVGAQGGEASAIWKYFNPNNVIVNVGRAVMFPNGSNSAPEEQAKAAKHYQEMLNYLRKG